jgi:hypothetical protein
MERNKCVYVSVPRDHHWNDSQRILKHAIYAIMQRTRLDPCPSTGPDHRRLPGLRRGSYQTLVARWR